MIDLTNSELWTETDDYGVPCAMSKIDMPRMGVGRWTYHLLIAVNPGDSVKRTETQEYRGSGFAEAAIISARPTPHVEYPFVPAGEIIKTPYGSFRVTYYQLFKGAPFNLDNLNLIEIPPVTVDQKFVFSQPLYAYTCLTSGHQICHVQTVHTVFPDGWRGEGNTGKPEEHICYTLDALCEVISETGADAVNIYIRASGIPSGAVSVSEPEKLQKVLKRLGRLMDKWGR